MIVPPQTFYPDNSRFFRNVDKIYKFVHGVARHYAIFIVAPVNLILTYIKLRFRYMVQMFSILILNRWRPFLWLWNRKVREGMHMYSPLPNCIAATSPLPSPPSHPSVITYMLATVPSLSVLYIFLSFSLSVSLPGRFFLPWPGVASQWTFSQ